jgi:hypothetical protein
VSEGTQHPGRWHGAGSRGLRQYRKLTRGLTVASPEAFAPPSGAVLTGRLDWAPSQTYAAFTVQGETTPLVIVAAVDGTILATPVGPRVLSTLLVARDGEYVHRLLELHPLADPDSYEAIERVRW